MGSVETMQRIYRELREEGLAFRTDLVKRMAKLPLIADIQSRFVASDFPWVLDRVGNERTEFLYLYAWKKLLQEAQ